MYAEGVDGRLNRRMLTACLDEVRRMLDGLRLLRQLALARQRHQRQMGLHVLLVGRCSVKPALWLKAMARLTDVCGGTFTGESGGITQCTPKCTPRFSQIYQNDFELLCTVDTQII